MQVSVGRKPGAAYERYLKKRFPDAASRDRFDREVAAVQAMAQIMGALETSRESLSLKKSELASRAGWKDPAVSRLLTSPGSNPTLKTWLELLAAMDLCADIRFHHRRKKSHRLVEVHGL
jgi:DNA-binding phage protein